MTQASGILVAAIFCVPSGRIQAAPQEADVVINLEVIPICMAYSPDGKRIAVSTGQRKEKCTIRLYDASSTKVLSTISGLEKPVRNIAFSPDGKNLATTGEDKTLRLWDLEANPPSELAKADVYERTPVAFSPDGNLLASCTSTTFDGKAYFQIVQLWTWKEKKLTARGSFKNQAPVATFGFTPDNKNLRVGNTNAAMGDAFIRTWDISGDEPTNRGTVVNSVRVHSVAFSENGKLAALGWGDGGAGGVKLWDLSCDPPKETAEMTLRDWVTCLAFSRDGESLAAAGGGFFERNPLTVWDLRGQKPQERYRSGTGEIVSQVSFSPDGIRLAALETKLAGGKPQCNVRILRLPAQGKKSE